MSDTDNGRHDNDVSQTTALAEPEAYAVLRREIDSYALERYRLMRSTINGTFFALTVLLSMVAIGPVFGLIAATLLYVMLTDVDRWKPTEDRSKDSPHPFTDHAKRQPEFPPHPSKRKRGIPQE